ncbi:MAG: F0F1 ATP synthase subunit alpha [Lentisphaerae bacterium]|nr:F0F1 ATP synthase subunit alpha [Lentisphaerota bacterium]
MTSTLAKIPPVIDVKEFGLVKEIKKDIVKIDGLKSCLNMELVSFSSGGFGMVMGFNESETLALVISPSVEVKVGDKVYSRKVPLTIAVGMRFVGRIVNALSEPLDGKGAIEPDDMYPVFKVAPGVLERDPVTATMETGILSIDSMFPVGKGQRELILGDKLTGKTSIGTDAILNQKGKNVICIYCCVGKPQVSLEKVIKLLRDLEALEYTIVVAATATAPTGARYLAPYTAATLAEYFMHHGRDVLVVFDDLTKHAWGYRELSLLLERSPGRDAYPGDVFYLHSQLMERAGRLKKDLGGGTATYLPIVELTQGDMTAYIPSNIVSMTDGQLVLNTSSFGEGFRPALDAGLSVSRIGSKVQSKAMKKLSGMLRLEYIQYKELAQMSKVSSTRSEEVTEKLAHGQALTQLLIQKNNLPRSTEEEIVLLYCLREGLLDKLEGDQLKTFIDTVFAFLTKKHPELIKELAARRELSPDIVSGLQDALEDFMVRGGYKGIFFEQQKAAKDINKVLKDMSGIIAGRRDMDATQKQAMLDALKALEISAADLAKMTRKELFERIKTIETTIKLPPEQIIKK